MRLDLDYALAGSHAARTGSSVSLRAASEGAASRLVGGQAGVVHAEARSTGGCQVLVGSEDNGVYLQAAERANLVQLRRGGPATGIQASAEGNGFVVYLPNGEAAVKIGVDEQGQAKHNLTMPGK